MTQPMTELATAGALMRDDPERPARRPEGLHDLQERAVPQADARSSWAGGPWREAEAVQVVYQPVGHLVRGRHEHGRSGG